MKCLSLWQPWALAWLLTGPDEKVFETRSWHCSYRGPMLVHAAKKRDGEVRGALEDEFVQERLALRGIKPADLYFGAIIGKVDIVGSCRMDRMPEPSLIESRWGNWSPERYAIERAPKPVIFKTPLPYMGKQGFFEVPDSLLKQVDLG